MRVLNREKKKNLVELWSGKGGGVGVGVGGGSGVQRLGWLVGGLRARQPKRAERMRPESLKRKNLVEFWSVREG